MKKNLCKILVIIIVALMLFTEKSYGAIGKDINERITNWVSGGYTGWTDELKQEEYKKILANLKNDFQYQGTSINNEMKMKTTISIEDRYKGGLFWQEIRYKIRIRNRNRSL